MTKYIKIIKFKLLNLCNFRLFVWNKLSRLNFEDGFDLVSPFSLFFFPSLPYWFPPFLFISIFYSFFLPSFLPLYALSFFLSHPSNHFLFSCSFPFSFPLKLSFLLFLPSFSCTFVKLALNVAEVCG